MYKHYNIEIDPTFLNVDNVFQDIYELDKISHHSRDIECLLAQQHTLLWKEDKYFEIAPRQNNKPLSIIYDEHAEKLSFRAYIWGKPELLRPT
jgi:hypothetical protein